MVIEINYWKSRDALENNKNIVRHSIYYILDTLLYRISLPFVNICAICKHYDVPCLDLTHRLEYFCVQNFSYKNMWNIAKKMIRDKIRIKDNIFEVTKTVVVFVVIMIKLILS